VVSHANTPVGLVRADAPRWETRFEAPVPTYIVPLDFSELAESALPVAQELAEATHGRLLLVSDVPLPTTADLLAQQGMYVAYSDSDYAAFEDEARTYLSQQAEHLRRTTPNVDVQVRLGQPAVEITAAAGQAGAAAIVMATHGRTGLTRSVLGSVAGEVLRRSPTPVLLVRPSPLQATSKTTPEPYPRELAPTAH